MAQRRNQPLVSAVVLVAIAMALAASNYASDLYSPWLFIFKALLQPITLVVLILITIFVGIRRYKSHLVAMLIAWLINVPFLLPVLFSEKVVSAQDESVAISAASFSTLTRTENVNDILQFIKADNPGILCLQEVSNQHRQQLTRELGGHYRYIIENNNNQITFSHFPIQAIDDQGHYQIGKITHPKLGTFEVINAHMPRPYLSAKMNTHWESLISRLAVPKRVILCGDLNITPNNSLYDLLRFKLDMRDSLTSGYGFTYPNAQRRSAIFGPLVRIDYILSRGFLGYNTRTVNVSALSDHRAVITQLIRDEGFEHE